MSETKNISAEKTKEIVLPRTFDTYMAVIRNSPGTEMFKNVYAEVNGEYKDITDNGDLSCAFFVSSVLVIFGLIGEIHMTVRSTIREMKRSGWIDTNDPKEGDVVIWGEEFSNQEKHMHIGFFLNEERAISNSKNKKHPIEHPLELNDRKVEMFMTNESFRGE